MPEQTPRNAETNIENNDSSIQKSEGGGPFREGWKAFTRMVAAMARTRKDQTPQGSYSCAPTPLYTPEEMKDLMALRKVDLENRRDAMENTVYAYIRIHAGDLTPERQEEKLGNVDTLFIDFSSGYSGALPQLTQLISEASWGDIIRVECLSRLGLTIEDAVATVKLITSRGVEVHIADRSMVLGPSSELDTDVEKRAWAMLTHAAEADAALREDQQFRHGVGFIDPFPFTNVSDDKPRLTIEQLREAERQITAGLPLARVAAAHEVSPALLYAATRRLGEFTDYPQT